MLLCLRTTVYTIYGVERIPSPKVVKSYPLIPARHALKKGEENLKSQRIGMTKKRGEEALAATTTRIPTRTRVKHWKKVRSLSQIHQHQAQALLDDAE